MPLVESEHQICSACLLDLPEVPSSLGEDNFVERRLRGRIPVQNATALYVFRQQSGTQQVLHQIKYQGNEELAVMMGESLGLHLAASHLFDTVDVIIPVPLHRRKQRRRGYNQSQMLCDGIAYTFPRPVMVGNLVRIRYTETQTLKNRQQRLDNMKDVFAVGDVEALRGKHVLLVDDVITTGATFEACWMALKHVEGITISVAALAVTGDT